MNEGQGALVLSPLSPGTFPVLRKGSSQSHAKLYVLTASRPFASPTISAQKSCHCPWVRSEAEMAQCTHLSPTHMLVCWLVVPVAALDPGNQWSWAEAKGGPQDWGKTRARVTTRTQWLFAVSPSSSESEAATQGQGESHCHSWVWGYSTPPSNQI